MEQDIASGTYDFASREYSPAQGRWWTPDPAGSAALEKTECGRVPTRGHWNDITVSDVLDLASGLKWLPA